jgi:hypothetical protein
VQATFDGVILSPQNKKYPVHKKKYPFFKKTPVLEEIIERIPMSKEHLAMFLGKNKDILSLQMFDIYSSALYDSVCNLVYKQAIRYSVTCPHLEVGDMVNDCWKRIIEKLHLYDIKKGKFTTWVCTVAFSVLSKTYRKGERMSKRFVEMADDDYERSGECNATGEADKSDFKKVIDMLKQDNQESAHIVQSLFYDKEGYLRPKIVFKTTAEECGIQPQKVSNFYYKVVKPFFYETFQGDYDNVEC